MTIRRVVIWIILIIFIISLVEDNEKVIIDNEALNIKNQINVIANKILRKCNVTHAKNKNNAKTLISGDGKLMFTNGLTRVEFEKKFHL